MKLIYRTLLLNKVCAQGSGAAAALSRTNDTEYIKQPCFFDVYLTWLFFRFKS